MEYSDQILIGPFLRRLALHSKLTDAEQRALGELPAEVEHIPARRDLVRIGQHVADACFIVEGLVGRFEQTSQGQRQITGLHVAGDLADLNSVVLPQAYSALSTLTATTIVRLPHAPLRLLAGDYPGIARAFWQESALDAARLSRWAANLGRKDAVARTAHLICELACRYLGSPPTAFDLPLSATQSDLGDMLGLTRNHVNRTFKVLRTADLLTWYGSKLRVLDFDKLVAIAEFDPSYLALSSFDANG